MKDIEQRNDIETIINSFYSKVKNDDQIGHFFNEIMVIDWEKHLPIMYDFWENVVFHTAKYQGNPMEKHFLLHQLSPLNNTHFDRWITLFTMTIDEKFIGHNSEIMKQRATSIALLMKTKILTT